MKQSQSQKYFNDRLLIAFVVVLNTVTLIASDMFLPALPRLIQEFGTTAAALNSILIVYTLFLAVGILVLGPLSDRFGRRRPLLAAIGGFILFSVGCGCCGELWQLVFCRVFQALAAGGVIAVTTALLRDCFGGEELRKALTIQQSMTIAGPVAAPFLGTLVLAVAGWRGIFFLLALMFSLCFLAALMFGETLPKEERTAASPVRTLAGLFHVAKQKSFSAFLLIATVIMLPYASYLGVCSYIYIDFFHLGTFAYSCFFAANAVVSILAPFLFAWLQRRFRGKTIVALTIFLTILTGVLLLTVGSGAPLLFFLAFLPFALAEGIIRPFAFILLLGSRQGDIGAASALINFMFTGTMAPGIYIATLGWSGYIAGLGWIALLCAAGAALAWACLRRTLKKLI